MHRIPSRPYPSRLARVLREDDGFGLIEVLVSAVMVVIVATATLNLIDRTNQASASSRSRVVASNLAHAALNNMRALTFDNLQDYTSTTSSQQGGITYSVKSDATWTTDTNTTLNCSSTGSYSPYLKVTATVTWPNMGSVAPITATSLVSPRASDVSNGTGSLVVTVQNAAGQGVQGATVSAQGDSVVTDADGCAIFHFLQAGTTTVTWFKSGYITPEGTSPGTQNVSITNNTIASITPSLDLPAKITTTFRNENGGVPASAPVSSALVGTVTTGGTFFQSAWFSGSATTDLATKAGTGVTHSNLFPTTSGYGLFAGSCSGNDPTLYVKDFNTKYPDAFKTPSPGGTAAGTAYTRTAWFKVTRTSSTKNAYRIFLTPYSDATYPQMADCTAGMSYTGTLANSNPLTVPLELPYGLYSVCIDNGGFSSGSGGKKLVANNVLNVMPSATARSGAPVNTTGTSGSPLYTVDLSNSGTTGGTC